MSIFEKDKKEEITNEKEDMVNHPKHYQFMKGFEVFDVIQQAVRFLGLTGEEAYPYTQYLGYILRWKLKGGLQDLKKARWFLDKQIEQLEKKEKGE